MNEGYASKPAPPQDGEDSLRNSRTDEERLESVPPPPSPMVVTEVPIALKERNVPSLDELSVREYSKEHMASQRDELAGTLRQERREGRDKLNELRVRVSLLNTKLESTGQNAEALEQELTNLETLRSQRADSLTGRIKAFLNVEVSSDKKIKSDIDVAQSGLELTRTEQEEVQRELEESTNQLVDADTGLKSLREKIGAHYSEAGDRMQRTVEQTMMRSNAFFVHTINEHGELRHNENSNVSRETGFDEDLDILLALEPSISASTVLPGKDEQGRVSGLWSHQGGVLLSGGTISSAHRSDHGTRAFGIKNRGSKYSDVYEPTVVNIDEAITGHRYAEPGNYGSYNEIVVNNPEISGYFKHGQLDEEGNMWIYGLQTKEDLAKLHEFHAYGLKDGYVGALADFNRNLNKYRSRFNEIRGRGLPFYVMTDDRRVFEVHQVNDNGTLSIGSEVTPEDMAKTRAGLPPEKRKEIGRELLKKKVFRNEQTHHEAESIVKSL